jgi:hypothetical protein
MLKIARDAGSAMTVASPVTSTIFCIKLGLPPDPERLKEVPPVLVAPSEKYPPSAPLMSVKAEEFNAKDTISVDIPDPAARLL